MKVCLVGATHPCHNPRLTREADTLVEAGYDVRVVAPSIMSELREKDIRHLRERSWRLQSVDYCPTGLRGKYRALKVRGARRLFQELFNLSSRESFAERAYIPALKQCSETVAQESA